ncbi:hypothetical protein BDR06DRAFT_143261 [Suillus hirtellus]|nr:hypothetical protein BDR06DRAFT_143261 [Suillus hirtellus]
MMYSLTVSMLYFVCVSERWVTTRPPCLLQKSIQHRMIHATDDPPLTNAAIDLWCSKAWASTVKSTYPCQSLGCPQHLNSAMLSRATHLHHTGHMEH